jgi:hypothetical protein
MSDEDLRKAIDDLSAKVADLGEANQGHRMRTLVAEGISAWEKRRGALLLLVLTLFGVATWARLSETVANYLASDVVRRIDEEVKKKTAALSVQDPAIAELQSRVEELSKDLRQKSAVPTPPPTPPPGVSVPTTGFAFFGIRRSAGDWSERYFSLPQGGDRPPVVGDEAIATGSVNIRNGYITYGPSGWFNQPSKGVLRRGERVEVTEIKEVVEGFWWIAFRRK